MKPVQDVIGYQQNVWVRPQAIEAPRNRQLRLGGASEPRQDSLADLAGDQRGRRHLRTAGRITIFRYHVPRAGAVMAARQCLDATCAIIRQPPCLLYSGLTLGRQTKPCSLLV